VLDLELEHALDRLSRLGLHVVEVACGGYFGHRHADAAALLDSPAALQRWHDGFHRRGLEISALALHGEPLAAEGLRGQMMNAIEGGGMREYFAPESGRGLGARDFGWTAALCLRELSFRAGDLARAG
jgi:sugar phosphate isomerase/epimerase